MRALSASELLVATAASLGVPTATEASMLLRPALRRAAFILAPTSRADLLRFVREPLKVFGEFDSALEEALDDLIAYGDILEMHRHEDDPWDAPKRVLRPAPPSFVARKTGELVLLGVAGGHVTALTADLQKRVGETGPLRVIVPEPGEALGDHLKLLGLVQLSEPAFLRSPTAEAAAEHANRWKTRLAASPPDGTVIDGLEILDPQRAATYYRGRWRPAQASDSGMFLARRPQRFGSPLWCLVDLGDGRCQRLMDFQPDDDRQRPCDLAWRAQASFDAAGGRPQRFHLRDTEKGRAIDVFSPLPGFAERRLALVAAKTAAPGCLCSFELLPERAADEAAALEECLWLAPSDKAST